MDKKTHTKFNLNNFLMALSSVVDKTVANNKNDVEFSSKSFAHLALKIASKMELSSTLKSDIFSYCILAKNPTFMQNIDYIPFNNKNFMDDTQVSLAVNIASFIIDTIKVQDNTIINEIEIKSVISSHETIPKEIKSIFVELSSKESFWYDIMSNQIAFYIFDELEDFTQEILFDDLIQFTAIVHDSIYNYIKRDYKDSCIDFKAYALCNYFDFDSKDKARFIIASHLHIIGLVFIPLNIINKDGKLHHSEYQIIKQAPYYTNGILRQVFGFNDIADICASYCEKPNGSGYPNKLDGANLSLKHRLLATLSAYQALSEQRVHRNAKEHKEICEILENENFDKEILKIISTSFS